MNILVLSVAEEEFAKAVDYYNKQTSGLGYEFAAEVKHAFERIKIFPEAWQLFSKQTRRCFLNRFPYGVLYRIDSDAIRVGAIMPLHCNPKHWHERVGKF